MLVGFAFLCCVQAGGWPAIAPISSEHSYVDDLKGNDTPFVLVVRDVAGNPVYRLECHNGDYDNVSGFNFSGDFDCALFALSSGVPSSHDLLATNAEAKVGRDWYNRGRMLAGQLWEGCEAVPEYGAVRHFMLRGMLITFEFKDLTWFPFEDFHRPRLRAFTFAVSFVVDSQAQTALAAPVGEPMPSGRCGW